MFNDHQFYIPHSFKPFHSKFGRYSLSYSGDDVNKKTILSVVLVLSLEAGGGIKPLFLTGFLVRSISQGFEIERMAGKARVSLIGAARFLDKR